MDMKCESFDSVLWESYPGAYGNLRDDVKMLMGELPMAPQTRLRRMETEEKTDEQILFDNICENLSHQMSFYRATYLVMPYLVTFLEHKDFTWQCTIISELGFILATDIPENKGEESVPDEIFESYMASIVRLKEMTKTFAETHIEEIRALKDSKREELLVGLIAILENPVIAYLLILNSGQDICFVCEQCEYCYEGDEEQEIQIAAPTDACETYKECRKLLYGLGIAEEKIQAISDYYGTLTCPECGAVMPMFDAMKAYFFG